MTVRDNRAGPGLRSWGGPRVEGIAPEDPRWAQFVEGHPEGLIYHHPAWSRVLHEAFGYEPAALASYNRAGKLSGILPLFAKRSLFGSTCFSSLPHTPMAGPVADDAGDLQALLSGAVSLGGGTSGGWVQLKVIGDSLDPVAGDFVRARRESTYVLDLPGRPESLRFGNSKNHARIRWAARKAGRLGVTVREASSAQDIRDWYPLYLETMRRHAVPPRPLVLFTAMWRILAPMQLFRLLLAEADVEGRRQILAGSAFLMGGHTVSYVYNGSRRTHLGLRPNDAIHWRAITDACASGFSKYDFGEAAVDNTGLAGFKEKWGARPVALHRYYYPGNHEAEQSLLPRGTARRASEWAWRHLPLRFTSGFGSWMYRRL